MILSLSFHTLLAGLLLVFSVQDATALPISHVKRSKTVSFPLRRHERRTDLHPLVALQQNLNRSHRRLARMTGRELPTDEQLRRNLERTISAVEDGHLAKRFNRHKHNNGAAAAAAAATTGQNANGNANGAAAAAAATQSGTAIGGPDSATGVSVADTPTTSNSAGLDIEGSDISYLATIQLGTPPVEYLMIMDSGSADTWVAGEDCSTCGNHQTLGSTSSSSFVDTGNAFQVTYGTGNVQGNIVQDTLTIAGLTLANHSMGVTTAESDDFGDDSVPSDGLMGLAKSELSDQGVLTPVEAMASNGLIDKAITAYFLPRAAVNPTAGEVTFGGVDSSKFDANTLVTVNNVNANGFFEAALDSVSVSGTDLGFSGRTGILDTGTTLLVIPSADATAIHEQIPGASVLDANSGTFSVPCDTTATVDITIGGQAFTIQSQDLAFQQLNNNECVSGISAGQIGGADEWLMGDTFLKNVYYVTDATDDTISLANQAT